MLFAMSATAATTKPLRWANYRHHSRSVFTQPLISPSTNARLTPAQAAEPAETVSSLDISGLDRDYCDDFVCNSSPSVEATIRAYARDLERCNGVWTRSLLSKNVEYKDTFRSLRGVEAYSRLNFMTSKMQGSKVQVLKLSMLDNGTALISWRLSGSIGPLPVDVAMESTLSLNLLTGQIERQSDSWDLSRCSPPASLAWTLTRALWSAQQASLDAKVGTQRVLDSLSSVDEDDGPNKFMNRDPTDPTRFFQQNDNTMQDAFQFAAFVALLWFMTLAYEAIFKLQG